MNFSKSKLMRFFSLSKEKKSIKKQYNTINDNLPSSSKTISNVDLAEGPRKDDQQR